MSAAEEGGYIRTTEWWHNLKEALERRAEMWRDKAITAGAWEDVLRAQAAFIENRALLQMLKDTEG